MITRGFDTGTTDSSWEWTVFTAGVAVWTNSTGQCVASCALSHEGGRDPCPHLPLTSVLALHMHIKRVKKPGWKQRRKKGCSPRNGRSCCVPPGQPRGLATCRGNKAKLHSLLPAVGRMEIAILWLNRTTSTTCGFFYYYQEKLAFIKRKHLWVLSWVCGWRCASTLLLQNPNSQRSIHCRIPNHKTPVILSV